MKKILFILSILIMVYSCNTTSNKDGKANPFFSEFDTPEGVPPFDKIKAEHFMPAFEEAMKRHNAEIDSIINNPDRKSVV